MKLILLLLCASAQAQVVRQTPSTNALTVTTNANLTGPVTSVGNATSIPGPIPTSALNLSTVTTGVTDASDAAAGKIGEYVSASTTSYTNWPCASGTWCDGPTIVLTAGDWDISLTAGAHLNDSVLTDWRLGAGTAASPTNDNLSQGINQFSCVLPTAANDASCSIGGFRSNSASPLTWRLKIYGTWSGATPQMIGSINARRMR